MPKNENMVQKDYFRSIVLKGTPPNKLLFAESSKTIERS